MRNYYKKLITGTIMIFGLMMLHAQSTGNSCDSAMPISEGIYDVADLEFGEGASNLCFGAGAIHAAWFEYTPTFSGVVAINSGINGVTPDTRLSVYSGPCTDLTCIGSDDDGGEVFSSFLQIEVTEGNSVYVEWDDRWDSEGFTFSIGEEDVVIAGCTDVEALNFNPDANVDDGSCFYAVECDSNLLTVMFEGGTFIFEVSWSITDEEGETYGFGEYDQAIQQICLEDGCYSFNMFDSFGDGWNGTIATLFLDDVAIAEGTLEDGNVGNFTFGVNTDSCDDIILEVMGCTDPNALNFNPNANVDDGSCSYPFECEVGVPAQIYIYTFGDGEQMGVNLSGDNATVVYDQDGFDDVQVNYEDICLEEGICYTVTMTNNEGPFGWNGGYYWISVNGITISTGSLEEGLASDELIFSLDGTCGEVFGCTDSEAENFNEEATVDDGSCQYIIDNDNCDSPTALSEGVIAINNMGATSEGLYGECWGFGSGEPEQNGIWYSFTTPEEPALIIIEAISDGTYTLTDTQFGLFDSCGGDMIYCDGNGGEGLLSKFEFECGMLEPATDYLLLIDGWAGDQGTCLLSYEVAEGCQSIEGCTDPIALNYNPDATIDNGSCVYSFECEENEVFISFELGSWSNEVSWYIVDLFNNVEVYAEGGVNDGMIQMACLPDGCYQLIMEDSFGDGWNGNIMTMTYNQEIIVQTTLEEGEYGIVEFGINSLDCGLFIEGCTDPLASNFNPLASIDDGSCEYDPFPGDCEASFEIYSVDETEDVVWILNTSTIGWGIEYFWDFGDGNTSYAPLPIHTYAEDGTYEICLTIYGPEECEDTFCMSITYEGPGAPNGGDDSTGSNSGFSINVIDNVVSGIEDNVEAVSNVLLFPNPALNMVNIQYDLIENSTVQLNVYDVTGARVLTTLGTNAIGQNSNEIDVAQLNSGLYLLEMIVDGQRSATRFNILK